MPHRSTPNIRDMYVSVVIAYLIPLETFVIFLCSVRGISSLTTLTSSIYTYVPLLGRMFAKYSYVTEPPSDKSHQVRQPLHAPEFTEQ